MVQARGVEGVRVLVGLRALDAKHTTAAMEQACHTAPTRPGHFRIPSLEWLFPSQAGPNFLELTLALFKVETADGERCQF